MKRIVAVLLMLLMFCVGCAENVPPADEKMDGAELSGDKQMEEATDGEVVSVPAEDKNADDESEENSRAWMQFITADNCITSNSYMLPLVEDGTTLDFWWPIYSSYLEYDMSRQEDYLFFKEMNQRTGVNINLIIPNNANEQFGLLLASGDIPDFIESFPSLYTQGLDNAFDEGWIVDLKDYEEQMPNLFAIYHSNDVIRKNAMTDDGIYGVIPGIQSNLQGTADKSFTGYVLRKDWLEALNMEVPTTYGELEEVLVAFRDSYCETPFILAGADGDVMQEIGGRFWGGFGFDESWYQIDGKVLHGPQSEAYREYIAMLADWYKQGLMASTFMESMNGGAVFLMASYTAEYATDDSVGAFPAHYLMIDGFLDANKENDGYELVGMPYLSRNKGEEIHIGKQADIIQMTTSGCIMADSDKIELTCKWFDYIFSEDGLLLSNYGLEGETFNFQEDGAPKLNLENLVLENGSDGEGAMLVFNMPGYHQFDRNFIKLSDTALEMYYVWNDSYDIDYIYPGNCTMTAEEGEEYSRIMSDVDTFISENLVRFVIGDKPMEEWDSFVETLNGMHVDEAMAIKQAALNRFNAR